MKIVKSILAKNPCYLAGRTIKVKGLMLHSVGCAQPSAQAFINSWNRREHKNSCVHAFVDGNTGTGYQTRPWNYRAWHCGGSANGTHIGVEMCEPSCISYQNGKVICKDKKNAKKVVKRTYKSAVTLFAELCKMYRLDPLKDGVIISHREGAARKVASNHGDPEHLWNALGLSYTMDGFRKAVNKKMKLLQ